MNIAVIMTTYFPDNDVGQRRLANARRVVQSLYNNLTPLPFLVVADDSGRGYGPSLELVKGYLGQSTGVHGSNRGVGASLNRALEYLDDLWGVNADWAWIYLPDDFQLMRPLDLRQAEKLIHSGFSNVRGDQWGYPYVRLDLPHPNLDCRTKFRVDIGWWIELDYTNGGFVFATRPTLIRSSVHRTIGPFLEQADSYQVEADYSKRVAYALLPGALVTSPPLGSAWEHLSTDEDEVGRLTPWQHPAVAP